MKLNLKGIRFKTWLYFLVFSFMVLGLLGFLLLVLIKPYYRENRIQAVDVLIDSIESSFIKERADKDKIENTNKLVAGNNVCTIIYNEKGHSIYESDSLGELCMLEEELDYYGVNASLKREPIKVIETLKNNDTISFSVKSPMTGYEMIVYGKKISADLVNYYLFLNTPLELMESYVDYILNQYLLISTFVIVVALLIGFVLANRITRPIIKMQIEANKLAAGNYNVHFKDNTESYSEINDLANALDDATIKLGKVDELRKDLVANVSHDIKTPLTMIQAYGEMIRDLSGNNPKKRNEHLEVILSETAYLNRLVTDMQEYSKMQAGYIELNKANFDLKDSVNEVLSLLDGLFKEKEIGLNKELSEVVVYADRLKITQVIYNFVSNALKHSSANAMITIRILDSEDKVRLEVIDNGDGISEEALPYIWDRYYKIDKSFSRTGNSTGLGLAIAKAILEAHKAEYGVSSILNEGSTFYFELSKDYEDETE